MTAMWISLKEMFRCGNRITDVIHHSGRRIKRGSCNFKDSSRGKYIHEQENSMQEEEIFRRYSNTRNCFHELEMGDLSRNIIEMIILRALSPAQSPKQYYGNIEQVLRVANSVEALKRFEEYRDCVKEKAYEEYRKHPRSMVDGNELLQFYSAIKTCCRQNPYKLCRDVACQVCRVLHTGFTTGYNRKTGIRLATSIEGSTGYDDANVRQRAFVVCRVIAGRVINSVDRVYDEDEYNSIGSEKYPKLGHLIIRNPSAVLPCFVVIMS